MPVLSEAIEIALYRIAQEALTNVIRHAGASHALVWLRQHGDELLLSIGDDGKGGPATLVRAGHYGVRGMQERAESLGATLRFQSGGQGGLQVELTLPMKETDA
jgi:two-component system sensor histidine kinase UhpB